jgi:hypothetical protein
LPFPKDGERARSRSTAAGFSDRKENEPSGDPNSDPSSDRSSDLAEPLSVTAADVGS